MMPVAEPACRLYQHMTQTQIVIFKWVLILVEATGFEPATPRPPAECATGLRHASNTPNIQPLY